MVDIKNIIEIFYKPSVEELQKDIEDWSGTLIRISDAIQEFQLDKIQANYFEMRLRSSLARGIAGTLPLKHRDRINLDRVADIYKDKASELKAEAEVNNNQAFLSRSNFITRAANLISATYNNPQKEGDTFNAIKQSVKILKKEVTL